MCELSLDWGEGARVETPRFGSVVPVMNVRSGLLAGAALVLSGCASTTLASTPAPAPEPSVTTITVAPTTLAPEPSTTVEAPAVTEPTVAPETTVPPPPTTTIPANVIAVPVADPPIVGVGKNDGPETQRAQERLLELGFWVQNANGDYGLTTTQAVMAFQKYYGLITDGVIGDQTAAVMTSVTERPRGRADAGTLVEIDKGLQLLFFVIDGKTEWVLNTSTGSEVPYDEPDKNSPDERQIGDSITRNGLHDVYRERPEGWWEGDLGEIYRPKYFTGGIAVHGSNSVPDYPASHGCVRVSVPAMDWIWDSGLMPLKTPVWVHEGARSAAAQG